MSRTDVQVLIVSEDRKLLRMLSRFLQMFGYRVRQTTRRDHAASLLETHRIDILIVDGGGATSVALEFCSKLTSDPRLALHVMLLADEARPLDVDDVLDAGVDDVLAKPVRFGELLARLRPGVRGIHWQRRVAAQGERDPVTRLDGRSALLRRVGEMLPTSVVTCLIADVDALAAINHRFGHDDGDAILRRAAACFRETLPMTELAACLAPGRFALLAADEDGGLMLEALEDLRVVFEQLTVDGREAPIPITLSIGYTLAGPVPEGSSQHGSHDPHTNSTTRSPASIVVQQAEYAVQIAKRSGGACAVRFGDYLDEEQEWKQLAEPGRLFETTKAKDVMTSCPVVLRTGDSIRTARLLFERTQLRTIPVVDDAAKLAGVLHWTSFGDADQPTSGVSGKVLQLMSPDVTTCGEEQPFAKLMEPLSSGVNQCVIIVRDGVPTGIVTPEDLTELGRPISHRTYAVDETLPGSEHLLIVPRPVTAST